MKEFSRGADYTRSRLHDLYRLNLSDSGIFYLVDVIGQSSSPVDFPILPSMSSGGGLSEHLTDPAVLTRKDGRRIGPTLDRRSAASRRVLKPRPRPRPCPWRRVSLRLSLSGVQSSLFDAPHVMVVFVLAMLAFHGDRANSGNSFTSIARLHSTFTSSGVLILPGPSALSSGPEVNVL